LVTPVPAAVSRPLIEGLRSESICTSTLAAALFPSIRPISYGAAVAKALDRPAPSLKLPVAAIAEHQAFRDEGVICDVRHTVIDAPRENVFALLTGIGGENGWFYGNWLWQVRGWMDARLGGVGMSRGRSRTVGMKPGDTVDFWRVEQAEASSTVLLRAEMKLPGAAFLQFDLTRQDDRTLLRCCAWFQPRGLLGEVYWYGLYPIHLAILRGMVSRIRQRAETAWRAPQSEVHA
jgi:hypothetical protein